MGQRGNFHSSSCPCLLLIFRSFDPPTKNRERERDFMLWFHHFSSSWVYNNIYEKSFFNCVEWLDMTLRIVISYDIVYCVLFCNFMFNAQRNCWDGWLEGYELIFTSIWSVLCDDRNLYISNNFFLFKTVDSLVIFYRTNFDDSHTNGFMNSWNQKLKYFIQVACCSDTKWTFVAELNSGNPNIYLATYWYG